MQFECPKAAVELPVLGVGVDLMMVFYGREIGVQHVARSGGVEVSSTLSEAGVGLPMNDSPYVLCERHV